MPTYQTARNGHTSLYEVHRAGCAHLGRKHMEISGGGPVEGTSAVEVAAAMEAANDGFIVVLGPCVKREKRGQ